MAQARPTATVVVPCFNEAARIDVAAMRGGLAGQDWSLLFVDDGSTDATFHLLDELRQGRPELVSLLRLARNQGKGEAVRTGLRRALQDEDVEIVAYLDADLSTPFSELARLVERLRCDTEVNAVLGSRVLRLGADIRRSSLRHLGGRVFATAASAALGVGVYDTQCGAKAFRRTPRLMSALAEPFGDRWSFDVELLARLTDGERRAWSGIVEEPLRVWHDRSGSRLDPVGTVGAFVDLGRIRRRRRSKR